MEKNLRLGKLWDEWLLSENSSKSDYDYEVSGILTGMKNFQTNRLRTARRLMRIWPQTSYYEKYKFTPRISLLTMKNQKARVKISFPEALEKILKFPKSQKSSWSWLKGLWGSAGGLYFPKNGYYLTLIISGSEISEIVANYLKIS
ncbi:MAG: hypothetical protein IJ597_06015, partial [Synergistaceae bacterium]|nr:hypothetical protein [Synergistaceae bacterium]